MPVIPTGGKPGRRPYLPLKLAVSLLYGFVPGVDVLGQGRCLVHKKELAIYLRTSNVQLTKAAQTLKDWGILSELKSHRSTLLVTMREPRLWQDSFPTSQETEAQ